MKVRKLGAEHRRNISAAPKGKNRGPPAPSISPNIAAANKGRKKNPEHVAKIAAANRGAWSCRDSRQDVGGPEGPKAQRRASRNIAAAMKDVDTRAAISAAKKGGRFIPRAPG